MVCRISLEKSNLRHTLFPIPCIQIYICKLQIFFIGFGLGKFLYKHKFFFFQTNIKNKPKLNAQKVIIFIKTS